MPPIQVPLEFVDPALLLPRRNPLKHSHDTVKAQIARRNFTGTAWLQAAGEKPMPRVKREGNGAVGIARREDRTTP